MVSRTFALSAAIVCAGVALGMMADIILGLDQGGTGYVVAALIAVAVLIVMILGTRAAGNEYRR